MAWQVQEAKQKFSELLRKAREEGPQIVTRHGEEVAVLVAAETFRELSRERNFKDFLRSGPDMGDLDIVRSRENSRPVDL